MSVVAIGRGGLAIAGLLAVALGVQTCRLSNAHARLARETVERAAGELRGAGFAPAEIGRPKLTGNPGIPSIAIPILATTGTARWGPVARGQAGAPASTMGGHGRSPPISTLDSAPPGGRQPANSELIKSELVPGCDLGELDISVTCRTEAVLLDGAPWVRTLASGRIVGYQQTRELPETVTAMESRVAPSIIPPRWRLDLLGGVSAGPDRLGLEAGAAWTGKGRLGGYLLGEWLPATSILPADWRAHGGVRIRLR